jgi:hypothetical protein
MSTGKTSSYIRKSSDSQSRLGAVGYKKTRFLHQAVSGDTLIQLSSLTVPTGVTGYSAPNASELTQTNLMQWSSNLSLYSSISGRLIQNVSYVVNGASTIKLLYAARDAEIFEGVIDHNVKSGMTLVDGQPIVISGTLAAGQTDFNVGVAFKVNQFPNYKVGFLKVEIDGQPAYRTDGNAAFGAGIDGDYYEVDSGGGLGQILRFQADSINDRLIVVTSVGALVEKPNGSVLQVMETIQGQIDALVPTVAELAEVPESNFQAAPNNTDLKSFGDRVLGLETSNTTRDARITTLESTVRTHIGTANTTNTGGLSSATFGTNASCPTITFTPNFTGKYKVTAPCHIQLNGTSQRVISQIILTSGSGTTLVTNMTEIFGTGAETSTMPFSIVQLTAGAPVTFSMQTRMSTGTGTYTHVSGNVDNGAIMIAEYVGA